MFLNCYFVFSPIIMRAGNKLFFCFLGSLMLHFSTMGQKINEYHQTILVGLNGGKLFFQDRQVSSSAFSGIVLGVTVELERHLGRWKHSFLISGNKANLENQANSTVKNTLDQIVVSLNSLYLFSRNPGKRLLFYAGGGFEFVSLSSTYTGLINKDQQRDWNICFSPQISGTYSIIEGYNKLWLMANASVSMAGLAHSTGFGYGDISKTSIQGPDKFSLFSVSFEVVKQIADHHAVGLAYRGKYLHRSVDQTINLEQHQFSINYRYRF